MTHLKLKKREEPPYALKALRAGGFGMGPFRGQHLIFVPMKIYELLGEARLEEIARDVYGEKALDDFHGGRFLYQNSFMMEFPPGKKLANRLVTAICNVERLHRKKHGQ